MTDAYNHSVHRSIGMRPVDVSKKDEGRLFKRMFPERLEPKRKKTEDELKPGAMVRVSKSKGLFEKGYLPNWSEEHFIVDDVNSKSRRRVYKLKDYEKEDVTGSWYEDELQPIQKNLYLIEKVLRKRKGARGQTELMVKWKGWPAKFISWIQEKDITPIAAAK